MHASSTRGPPVTATAEHLSTGARDQPSPFLIRTDLTSLAVTLEHDAVTEICFGGSASRTAATTVEHRVADELLEYFAGTRTEFTVLLSPVGTDFQRAVWRALQRIPYGETRTYGEIAEAVGRPGAARAVGTANHSNPIPIIIPCHRVVGSNGRLCGFGGGLDLKRRLLELEASHTPFRFSSAR